ncbi:Alcohol dehydrogenase 2 [Spatholobus suberectus]|nr:Alcohol dehydrogenase 2 [Spatholobus suberectus]
MYCFNDSVVESVGEQVTNLKEGDVVIPTYIGECQECENCVSEETNLCLTYPVRWTGLLPDNTSRMSIRGQQLYHVLSCATWSEYMAVIGAKMQGASRIIGIDKNEKKREKGEAFAMTDFINPADSDKSASELVKELTGGMGVDYSFECTGVSTLLTESLEATKVGTGKAILIGVGAETILPLGVFAILLGRNLKGSVFGGLKAISDLSIVVNKCHKKEFPLQELFTHEVTLADINEAFELVKQPNCVKVVINMSC